MEYDNENGCIPSDISDYPVSPFENLNLGICDSVSEAVGDVAEAGVNLIKGVCDLFDWF